MIVDQKCVSRACVINYSTDARASLEGIYDETS